MLLLNLIPLIDVTFSTPTGVITQNPVNERNRDFSPTIYSQADIAGFT